MVMTNQMTADPGGGMTFVPDPKKVGIVLARDALVSGALAFERGIQRLTLLVIHLLCLASPLAATSSRTQSRHAWPFAKDTERSELLRSVRCSSIP